MTTPDVDLSLELNTRFPLVLVGNNWCGDYGHLGTAGDLVRWQRTDTLRQAATELEKRLSTYEVQWGRASRSETGFLIQQLSALTVEWRALAATP